MKKLIHVIALSLATLLVACGGGGNNNNDPADLEAQCLDLSNRFDSCVKGDNDTVWACFNDGGDLDFVEDALITSCQQLGVGELFDGSVPANPGSDGSDIDPVDSGANDPADDPADPVDGPAEPSVDPADPQNTPPFTNAEVAEQGTCAETNESGICTEKRLCNENVCVSLVFTVSGPIEDTNHQYNVCYTAEDGTEVCHQEAAQRGPAGDNSPPASGGSGNGCVRYTYNGQKIVCADPISLLPIAVIKVIN